MPVDLAAIMAKLGDDMRPRDFLLAAIVAIDSGMPEQALQLVELARARLAVQPVAVVKGGQA